jgi:hypothetical protein
MRWGTACSPGRHRLTIDSQSLIANLCGPVRACSAREMGQACRAPAFTRALAACDAGKEDPVQKARFFHSCDNSADLPNAHQLLPSQVSNIAIPKTFSEQYQPFALWRSTHGHGLFARAAAAEIWLPCVLTEIYLCHACSDHEILVHTAWAHRRVALC